MRKVILLNKPFNVLSQFTDREHMNHERQTLSSYVQQPDVYPAGRLDRDSEGLLVLTNSGQLKNKLTHPEHHVSKTYWTQVEGIPSDQDLQRLREGVELKDGPTLPAKVQSMASPVIWPRHPPIRTRKSIPTDWLSLTISEGRNRQVRRMCAHIGFPVLRLVRYRVGSWTLDGLAPGDWREVTLRD